MGVPFGWAKPVPVPGHFREGVSERKGMMITAIAGPISNLILAALAWGLLAAMILTLNRWDPELSPQVVRVLLFVSRFLQMMILVNVALAAFNLLPVPPLDGSRVVNVIVPDSLRGLWNSFYRAGILGVVVLLVILPRVLHVNLLAWPIQFAQWAIGQAFGLR